MSSSISAQTVVIAAADTEITASGSTEAPPAKVSAPITMRTISTAQGAFDASTPFVRKDGEGRKRIVIDYGKLFSAYRSNPESIRRTTIPAVPSPESNNRVELREIHAVAGHRNHQKHVVLLGDGSANRKTFSDAKSILHEIPNARTAWVASVLVDVGDVVCISTIDRGSIVSLFYGIASFCSWPSDAGVTSIRGDIGVNIELLAIRSVSVMTQDVSVWQEEEELGAQLNNGVNAMFTAVQELFHDAPEDTMCYLEYFGPRYADDTRDDSFVIPEGHVVSSSHVENVHDFLLELRDRLVALRTDISDEGDKLYEYPLRGTLEYTFEDTGATLTLRIPNPRKDSVVPAVKLTTHVAPGYLPAWLANEPTLCLEEPTLDDVRQAVAYAKESADVESISSHTIEFMTRM